MAFQNSFTGKGTAVELPSNDGVLRSQENMNNLLLRGEELKTQTFQKNQAEFLKNANIDPVFVLADSARQTQAKMLEGFNNKWAGVMRQKDGNLSMDDKMQMARDKDYIMLQQQTMQSDMQQALASKDAIQKDVQGNLDHDDFQKRWDDYISTGKWDASPLLPSVVNPDEFFNKATNKVNGTPSNVVVQRNIGGVPYKETYQASGSEQEGREMVKTTLLSNDRIARGYIQKFQELKNTDPKTYQRYLDTNGDGKVSPSEENAVKTASNPILQWAQDNYWHKALDMKLSTPTKISTGSTSSSGNMRTWQGQKYTPTSSMDSPYPGLPSNAYHPFPNLVKQVTIPITSMELLEPDKATNSTEKPQQAIKGFVTGYDEKSDKITFLISQDYKDLDYPTLASGKGMQIAVPRNAFSKEIFDDLEVMKDGKLVKLKDITPAQTTVAPPKKLKFNYVTGKLE